jgi:hypothetical protein
MFRFFKLPHLAAVLAGMALLAAPGLQAQASFAITVFVDGVNQGVALDAGSNANGFSVSNAVVSNFDISSITSTTNFSGTPSGSLMSNTSNNKISTAFGAGGGTHTITVVISENGWLAPTGTPLTLSSSANGSAGDAGGSVTVNATNQGFLDTSNTLATTTAPGGSSTTLANATASQTAVGTANLIYSPSPSVASVPGGTPFTMTEVFSFKFTVSAGSGQDTANVAGSVSAISAAVPEPASLVLAFTGLPFLGLGWLRRRRNKA